MGTRKQTVIDAASGRSHQLHDTREIAPGVFVGGISDECIPRVGFFALKKAGDGTFVPVFLSFAPSIRLTKDIGKRLGIAPEEDGGDGSPESVYYTIKRLIHAGLVQAKQLTRNTYRLDLASFWRFWAACGEAGYWTEERQRRFREARYQTRDQDED